MEKILRFLEKNIIPDFLYRLGQPVYHFCLAFLGAFYYGFPSKKMMVIGVTGTKGKSTTCYLIYQILNSLGIKTGLITTVKIGIGIDEWDNMFKQTMPGRFQSQELLARMAKKKCHYVVVETSSEGILQYRYSFIDYDAAVFLNLSPEHIERHGGFENYRDAKVKLFKKVAKKKNSVGVYNLDDENVQYFLEPRINHQYVFTSKLPDSLIRLPNLYHITDIQLKPQKTAFSLNGEKFEMPLVGEFNIYNVVAAICAVLSQGINVKQIKETLLKVKAPAGRMEFIEQGQDFIVIVDYAHEPASLESVYKAAKIFLKPGAKKICLLGSQGGGRDKWKRPVMGKIAAKYCDKIILTNEDPYDEDPSAILKDIRTGISRRAGVYQIINRKEAIRKALSLAKKGDVIVLTGKGGEKLMCVENNKKIRWDETDVVKKLIGELVN